MSPDPEEWIAEEYSVPGPAELKAPQHLNLLDLPELKKIVLGTRLLHSRI